MSVARAALAGLALASALAACSSGEKVIGPPGSIGLFLDTDAPLPPPGGLPVKPGDPEPLFDRALVEIFPPGSRVPCTGCVNAFALDVALFRDRNASLVVAPTPDTPGYRARVRLFLTAHARGGEPDPRATIDVTVALPTVPGEGRTDITVTLLTDAVGTPAGTLDAPLDPTPGRPTTSLVGTWPDAARVDCADAPRPGEVCVPGGAFWMGDATELFSALPQHDDLGPHLVVLAPFFMDATEMTVATYRKTALPAVIASGSLAGNALTDYCTMEKTPGAKEDYPIVCVSWVNAHAACVARGSHLPTEAQFEYVASGLGRHRFPWGDDLPSCGDAIFGRTGYGLFAGDTAPCKPPAAPGGPTTVGSGVLDRVLLPTGTITDLAGNIGEFTRDDWNRHDEPCWNTPGVYRDPVCVGKSAADGVAHAERGGDWLVTRGQLARTVRSAAVPSLLSPEIGFRCARPAVIP